MSLYLSLLITRSSGRMCLTPPCPAQPGAPSDRRSSGDPTAQRPVWPGRINFCFLGRHQRAPPPILSSGSCLPPSSSSRLTLSLFPLAFLSPLLAMDLGWVYIWAQRPRPSSCCLPQHSTCSIPPAHTKDTDSFQHSPILYLYHDTNIGEQQ